MDTVVKFTTLAEAQNFATHNPDYRITMVVLCGRISQPTERKFYVAYNRKKNPPLNNALIEYWLQKGLI